MEWWWNVGFEVLKLSAQFAGALFIARKAVQWALGRYKREKHWERKLHAYSELLAALGTMNQVLGEWEIDEIEHREPKPEVEDENRKRYNSARQKIEEAVGVAELILSPDIAKMLSSLNTDLRNARYRADNWMEAIGAEWSVLEKLRRKLIESGRADLNIAP
jgi:hypothetical protein